MSVFQLIVTAVAILSLVTGAGAVWKPVKSVQNVLEYFGISQPDAESLLEVEIESIHDLVPYLYSKQCSGTVLTLKSKPSAADLKMFLQQFQQWRIAGVETMQKLEKIVNDLDGREYVKNILENVATELKIITVSFMLLPMILPISPLAPAVAGSMALLAELGKDGYILVKYDLDKLSIEDAKTLYKNHVGATNRMLQRLLTLNLNIDQQYDFLDDKTAEFDDKSDNWSYLKLVFRIVLDATALHHKFISTGAKGAQRATEAIGVENAISFFDNLKTTYEIFDFFTSGSEEMNSEKILEIKLQLDEHFKHMQILEIIIEEAIQYMEPK